MKEKNIYTQAIIDSKHYGNFCIQSVKDLGSDAAILLGVFCNSANYFDSRNLLTRDKFFYITIDYVEEQTGLSAHKQRKAVTILVEKGLIEVDFREMPAKRYIKVLPDKIRELYAPKCKDSKKETSKNDVGHRYY